MLLQEFCTEGMAGNGVQVMHEILLPLPTSFLSLFSDISTVLIIQFGYVLQTTKQIFVRAEELKRDLINEYTDEHLVYLTEKVSVRRSMDIGGLCDNYSLCTQDCLVQCL